MRLLVIFALTATLVGAAVPFDYAPLDRRQSPTTTSTLSVGSTVTDTTSSTPSSTATGGPGKAGLAWANENSVDIRQFEVTGKVTWYYTWSPHALRNSGWGSSRNGNTKLEFVPMLWGNRSLTDDLSTIEDVIRSNRTSGGVKAVLGFNEPEQPGQSNFSPSVGVQLWLDHLLPLASKYPGLRLGTPAVSSGPQGKAWLQSFFQECAGRCNVDFVAMHWYGINPDAFIAHLWDYHYTFSNFTASKTLWVTEWACHNFVSNEQCSQSDVNAFLNQTQNFMDETEWVERYAWFGAMRNLQGVNPENALMDSQGDINSLGRQYVDASPDQSLRSGTIGLGEARLSYLIALHIIFSGLGFIVLGLPW
ncbi:hypothetical protein H1R20_g1980, partial [Candolleomyces eurysporus]